MSQNERRVTAGPRLSKVGDALPQGFRAADPAELENVQGGLWGLVVLATIALIACCEGSAK
jgi:hypothetical protein